MPRIYFIGVDVGTSSARAALVNSHGFVVQSHVKSIKTWNPQQDYYEQSSDDIWQSVCECVKRVSENCPKHEIVGIGFDATCSLVVLNKDLKPLSISLDENDEHNIILWMDHRAKKETTLINSTNHNILKYVGGHVSTEMEIPKLLWIKNNLQHTWDDAGYFFDLPDFLTWKATNSLNRSLCSVVCKWNYDSVKKAWPKDFFELINLHELCDNNFEKIGQKIIEPGCLVGQGLTEKAASELGLLPGTAVGVSLIDAHAGALALFGYDSPNNDDSLTSKMGLICGTSSCHLSLTNDILWVSGVWGPYKGAIFPKMFLMEAGQSATGILIDHIIKTHPCFNECKNIIGEQDIYSYLNERLNCIAKSKDVKNLQELTKDIHIWPDYHGNRSPIADPNLRGMITGLSMNTDIDSLALLYLATIQALAYGTRHILDHLVKYGHPEIKTLLICGGLSKNKLFIQTYSDICMIPVLLPDSIDTVLVGAAILGACAAKVFCDLESASKSMAGKATEITPNNETKAFHLKKYKVFLKMLEHQREYREIMN